MPHSFDGIHPVGREIARLAVLLAVWLWAVPAAAQYRLDHWSADDGLPHNAVRSIEQTREGYLWLATGDGLARFDGVRFTIFDKSNTPGIPANRVFSLVEDRNGDVWATFESGEVGRFHAGRFETYPVHREVTGDPVIPSLVCDTEGNAMVYDLTARSLGDRDNGLILTIDLYRWSDGGFHKASELDVQLASRTDRAFVNVFLYNDETGLSCVCLTEDTVHRVALDGGARLYNADSGLHGLKPRAVFDDAGRLRIVTVDRAGTLWITELETMERKELASGPPEEVALWSGYADREGNYWFATNHNGLYRARPQSITPFDTANGLDLYGVYPILERRDGSVWIGTADRVLIELKNGSYTRFTLPRELFPSGVCSLYEDRAGRLWINATHQFTDGRFIPAPWLDLYPESTRLGAAWTMCEDSAGAYWIGRGSGVVRYQDRKLTHYTRQDGLAGDDTKVIVEDNEGGLWFGSSGGLTHYSNGQFRSWTERDGVPGNSVRALKVDDDGTLWIGTYDSGLGRFKEGHFTRYTKREGLYDNGVFQILEDDKGYFWMSCNRGIFRVRKRELDEYAEGGLKTLSCLAFSKSDGMPSSECNGGRWPAGVRTRDGRLWFPTMAGVAMIDPANIRQNTQPPPVVVESMRINNEPVSVDIWYGALQNPDAAIEILPGQDNFEIEYTALSFVNSENLRFKYRLEGVDHDWVDAGTRRTAYFSHLAPGHYTFRVIATNSDGVWNETGASVRITIVPPFWRTWWFSATIVVAVASAIAGAWRFRVDQLRRAQVRQQAFARQLLESQEAERKRIAGELHDSLGQNLLVLKNRAMINSMTLRDDAAKTQFGEFSSAVALTIEEVRSISHDLRPPHLDQLGLRTALVAMIENVAASSPIRFEFDIAEIDDLIPSGNDIIVYRIVQEALNNVLKHSGARRVDIEVQVDGDGIALTIRDDGRGFVSSADTGRRPGLGLIGLAERVRILGGTHEIVSSPGYGTVIAVNLPFGKTTT